MTPEYLARMERKALTLRPTLLPCPWCGPQPFVENQPEILHTQVWWVQCPVCGTSHGGDLPTPTKAAEAWNNRGKQEKTHKLVMTVRNLMALRELER